MKTDRRSFIKNTAIGATGIAIGGIGMSAKSYGRIIGANERIQVGIIGFSGRAKGALLPAFMQHREKMNFDIVAISDIWNERRETGQKYLEEQLGHSVLRCRNNEELYAKAQVDAVIISTADFQHALHTIEAVQAGCDTYTEKPLAETMEDAKAVLKAVKDSGKIVQIGSQRRSGANYHAAAEYIASGKFGPISIVEMTWNVNQPGRWRLPELTSRIRKEDTDWNRFLMNRPYEDWDPRKYLEYRLFWPYSSGIPGQWMSHQIDTVHWFSGLNHPRSVAANGGIYVWKDGRRNFDTMTAVFDYGPSDEPNKGFQVIYSSRQHNSAGGVKELYYSNGGELNLVTNKVTPTGGLTEGYAKAMGMKANLLEEYDLSSSLIKVNTDANTGGDPMTSAHMLNWMESVRNRTQPHAPIEAGYNHSVANIMVTASLRTGEKATFCEQTQEVLAGGRIFKY